MAAANATELYIEMVYAIKQCPSLRTATDPSSPCRVEIIEASPGKAFSLRSVEHNLVMCVPVSVVRAKAMVLHLFANTELATPMIKIPEAMTSLSKVCNRYYWRGAYGPIIMPQIVKCVKLLREYPNTRRAVVSMLDGRPHSINRPACISCLQFTRYQEELHLVVSQRALRLDMMPYDCVILTEILRYVSKIIDTPSGALHWYVGNLHAANTSGWDAYDASCSRHSCVHIDTDTPWEDLCVLLK